MNGLINRIFVLLGAGNSRGAVSNALSLVCVLFMVVSCASIETAPRPERVLFIGNSVVHTNNLPAIFANIAKAQPAGAGYRVDMFTRGGATLTELGRDPRVLELIESGVYDVVVLQERGGDDLCMLEDVHEVSLDCEALIESHVRLARLARERDAQVMYLGTFQLSPEASQSLVRAERNLATRMAAQYVEVSEHLRRLRESDSELQWLDADGGHPGIATTFLMGALIYESLSGTTLVPFELCTGATLYTPKRTHDGVARDEELVAETRAKQCALTKPQMQTIMHGISLK